MANSFQLASELLKLIEPATQRTRLAPADARPAIVAAMGVGDATVEAGTGGGIASPITEVSDTRIFHDFDITSPDGLLVLERMVDKTINARDADGNEVVVHLDNPHD